MAMNIGTLTVALRNRIDSELTTQLAPYIDIDDDHTLTGYTLAEYLDRLSQGLATAIANEVINHITANAKCSGVDSRGDTHDAVGIV